MGVTAWQRQICQVAPHFMRHFRDHHLAAAGTRAEWRKFCKLWLHMDQLKVECPANRTKNGASPG